MKIPSLATLSLVSLLVLGGCTWFSDPPRSEATVVSKPAAKPNAAGEITNATGQAYYVVKADFTPLYRTGPQQPNGPDQSLPKDTLVTLLKKSFGFSRVQLENGLNGYVATEDLQVAPPERIAPPEAVVDNIENNSAIVQRFSAERAAESAATSTSNAEALPDLPEPRLEPEPTAIEKPDFRY